MWHQGDQTLHGHRWRVHGNVWSHQGPRQQAQAHPDSRTSVVDRSMRTSDHPSQQGRLSLRISGLVPGGLVEEPVVLLLRVCRSKLQQAMSCVEARLCRPESTTRGFTNKFLVWFVEHVMFDLTMQLLYFVPRKLDCQFVVIQRTCVVIWVWAFGIIFQPAVFARLCREAYRCSL